ncbi:MAG: hypothetical protein WCJ75_13865 [Desulfomonile sp.]|jgi:hypothetical protein
MTEHDSHQDKPQGECRRRAKTVAEHRQQIEEKCREQDSKYNRFKILPRGHRNHPAYLALTMFEREILHCALDQERYHPNVPKGSNGANQQGKPMHNTFKLQTNLLIARGVKSSRTIADGKVRLWEIGWLDVAKTGLLLDAGEFRNSDRWRQFPDGDYKPHDQPRPGHCLYPPQKRNGGQPRR